MKQTEGTETANISFDLGAATMEYGNNAPYFQWGRKDPLPPSTGMANANKPIYGTYTALNNMSTADIAVTIRTPYYFNSSNGNPSLELWDVGNTVTTVNVNPIVKSIYDPSPAGFHVPCSGAFQGWNESGRSYRQNTVGRQGWFVYQLGPYMGDVVFFPVLGCRMGMASAASEQYGYFWTAIPYSNSKGRLLFLEGSVAPEDESNRYYGYSVRPVIE